MIASFFIGLKIGFQKIGEEKQLQNKKHDEQLNKDDQPYLSPPFTHIAKSIVIQTPNP